jgi:acetolactate synthase-1/2/3 large subunit
MVRAVSETRAATRIGGHVVAESLRALGADVVFGIPGVHALPMWEGLRETDLRVLGFRQELNAGFAADGYARATGRPAPLLVSTGPGAFMTLGPLVESASAFVPVVVVSSQIETDAIGQGRGALHETPDQMASFAPLVKWTGRASSPEGIASVLAEAWQAAARPPQGPAYVEMPFDVLHAEAGETAPAQDPMELAAAGTSGDLDHAASLLANAERPLVVAGGGAVRSGAGVELLELARSIDAPVATTYTGKGAIPERDPLCIGSAWDDAAHRELVGSADVVLCVGSWLGYELTESFRPFDGTLIQIDAAPERIGVNVPAIGLAGDARSMLDALLARIESTSGRDGEGRAAAVRERVDEHLASQSEQLALDVLETVEGVLDDVGAATWDSTILAYAACWYLHASSPRQFLYPAGSSTLGYALPAALGVAAALPGERVLAIVGDGGFQYGIPELATAAQHGLDVTLLVVDDRGYGILREYQDEAGFGHAGVDLEHADFLALFSAYGIPARRTTPEELGRDLRSAFATPGPSAVVLPAKLSMPVPSG